MYDIDFMTCTARDVIARSVTCHPSLLADSLRAAAQIHAAAAIEMRDGAARRQASEMAACAAHLADEIDDSGEFDFAAFSFTDWIIAFECARKLQCLPRNVASDIINRSEVA